MGLFIRDADRVSVGGKLFPGDHDVGSEGEKFRFASHRVERFVIGLGDEDGAVQHPFDDRFPESEPLSKQKRFAVEVRKGKLPSLRERMARGGGEHGKKFFAQKGRAQDVGRKFWVVGLKLRRIARRCPALLPGVVWERRSAEP